MRSGGDLDCEHREDRGEVPRIFCVLRRKFFEAGFQGRSLARDNWRERLRGGVIIEKSGPHPGDLRDLGAQIFRQRGRTRGLLQLVERKLAVDETNGVGVKERRLRGGL